MLSFLKQYVVKDEGDGMLTGRTYVVRAARVASFVEFLCSSQRRLPVVLISPTQDSNEPLMPFPDIQQMSCEVQGVAHITKLRDSNAADRFRQLLPRHACYNGAVRVFWPGYLTESESSDHPFWHPGRLRSVGGCRATYYEVLDELLSKSPQLVPRNTDVNHLQQQRIRQLEASQASDRDWDELYMEYERTAKELDTLSQLNQSLQQENRGLRWQLSTAWQKGQVEIEDVSLPSLYLSAQACRQFTHLDGSERDYWERHLFPKMLNASQCSPQSEPMEGPNGTCWVYPRSGAAGGRRVIYYRDGEDVRICELFPSHEEYERLRTSHQGTGIDRETYRDFELMPFSALLRQGDDTIN